MKLLKTILTLGAAGLLATSLTSCSDLQHSAKAPIKGSSFFPAIPVPENLPTTVAGKDKHGYPNYAITDTKRYVRTTAYSDQENEPGAIGNLNAAGTVLKYGNVRSAAADWSVYPLGTLFKIKGLPYTYFVDDYGSALVGTNTVDIYHPTLRQMNKWGTRPVEIEVIKMGDWERSEYVLKGRRKYRHCGLMYNGVVKNKNLEEALVAQKIANESFSERRQRLKREEEALRNQEIAQEGQKKTFQSFTDKVKELEREAEIRALSGDLRR